MNRQDLTGFAVDFGGSKITAARIVNGDIAASVTQETNRNDDLNAQLDHIDAMLRDLGFANDAPVGMAVTGRLSRDGHWSAINAATLPNIQNAPLSAALKARYRTVACCNDAFAATVAEARFGAGKGCQDFVYLTVSTGVGGGMVLNGQPVAGARGIAGHFGFTSSALGREICGSGRGNTVEAVAAGLAMAKAADAGGHTDHSAKDLFQLAARGSDWAEEIIDNSARSIAGLVADLAVMIDPEKIAIGGGVGLAVGYIDRVKMHVATEPAIFHVPIVAVELDHAGPLLGALALVP